MVTTGAANVTFGRIIWAIKYFHRRGLGVFHGFLDQQRT